MYSLEVKHICCSHSSSVSGSRTLLHPLQRLHLTVRSLSREWRGFQHWDRSSTVSGIMATEFHNLQELRHTASLATKVFIQRDYSDGTICKFQTKFPTELDSRIERSLFEETVKTLNCYYAEAEKISGQSYLESCLACATAYFIFLCMETRYEKILKKISMYIQEQNEKIFAPRGLLLTDPIERGMRVIEISIFEDSSSSSSSSSGSSPSSSTAQ
ncbi:golgin subfamily A member 7B [Danio aesculapii]|uniref:golgin subfamily A member 7B n=1 Tax=Danio aesculapii TaxID=1142201 RepID=UPI0024C0118E|nr:golgin subfamily A member 7B [Danio aesculapii]